MLFQCCSQAAELLQLPPRLLAPLHLIMRPLVQVYRGKQTLCFPFLHAGSEMLQLPPRLLAPRHLIMRPLQAYSGEKTRCSHSCMQAAEMLQLPPRLLELLRLIGVHLYHDVRTLTRLVRVLIAMVHAHRGQAGPHSGTQLQQASGAKGGGVGLGTGWLGDWACASGGCGRGGCAQAACPAMTLHAGLWQALSFPAPFLWPAAPMIAPMTDPMTKPMTWNPSHRCRRRTC